MNLPDQQFTPLLAADRSQGLPPIINVGCGTDLTIAELAELIARVVDFGGRIIWDTTKPDGTGRKLLDVTRLTVRGFTATTEILTGLGLAYQQFVAEMYK